MRTIDTTWTPAVEQAFRLSHAYLTLAKGTQQATLQGRKGQTVSFWYQTVNILKAYTNRMSDLQAPESPRVVFPDATDPALTKAATALLAQSRLPDLLYPICLRKSPVGYTVVKLVVDPTRGTAQEVLWGNNPGEFATFNYDPTAPWETTAVNFWFLVEVVDPLNREKKTTYRVRERHELVSIVRAPATEDGQPETASYAPITYDEQGNPTGNYGALTTYRAWKEGEEEKEPTPWETLAPAWAQGGQPAEVTFTAKITMLPGYLINNRDTTGDGVGDSDYDESLLDIQEGINVIMSSRHFTIRVAETPDIAIPEDMTDATGGIDFNSIKMRITRPGEATDRLIAMPAFQGTLESSSSQIELLMDAYYLLSDTSPVLDGKGTGSDASGAALRLSLQKPIIATTRRRQPFTGLYLWDVQYRMMLARLRDQSAADPSTVSSLALEWKPPIPADLTVETQICSTAKRDNVMSDELYVKRINPDFTPTQVQQEIARRDADNMKAAGSSLGTPGFIPAA